MEALCLDYLYFHCENLLQFMCTQNDSHSFNLLVSKHYVLLYFLYDFSIHKWTFPMTEYLSLLCYIKSLKQLPQYLSLIFVDFTLELSSLPLYTICYPLLEDLIGKFVSFNLVEVLYIVMLLSQHEG